jgi:hypothetical protein
VGQWLNEAQVLELRRIADIKCVRNTSHEQISDTLPFCRHCGDPIPLMTKSQPPQAIPEP